MSERFQHKPMEFVAVLAPQWVNIGVADREAFDKIAAPLTDHGENERGHVLTKAIEQNGTRVVFQYWIKSLTLEAFMADRKAAREAARAETAS